MYLFDKYGKIIDNNCYFILMDFTKILNKNGASKNSAFEKIEKIQAFPIKNQIIRNMPNIINGAKLNNETMTTDLVVGFPLAFLN